MDVIQEARSIIKSNLFELDSYIKRNNDDNIYPQDHSAPSSSIINVVLADKDKNLNKILEQQNFIKVLVEKDVLINNLKRVIRDDRAFIEQLRKECAQMSINALKQRQELSETQASDIERYQMDQLRSIVEDYQRHELVLDTRKKEISTLKNQIENESKNRSFRLKELEIQLERMLTSRQHNNDRNKEPNPLDDPDSIQLDSIDEIDLFGAKAPSSSKSSKRGGGSRGRGRRRGGGATG